MTITPPAATPDPTAMTPDAAPPVVDQAFLDLVEKLKPILGEVAKAAITEAVSTAPIPILKPGVVQGVTQATRTASILVDGDTTAITAQILVDLPGIGDRVMVEFVAPSAVFMVGFVTDVGIPAGSIQAYAGTVSADLAAGVGSATPGNPPRGWLWCHGQAVSRTTYSVLFAAISTTYGTGDGATTFNVPDFRGRVPIGLDNMGGTDAGRLSVANTLGGTGGVEGVTIAAGNLPAHHHTLGAASVASHNHDLANHTHSGTTSSDGDHTHTQPNSSNITGINSTNTPGSNNFAESFGASPDTGSGGSHNHSMTTGTPSNNTSGNTTPGLSGQTDDTGSGTALTTLPPYLLVNYLIKC